MSTHNLLQTRIFVSQRLQPSRQGSLANLSKSRISYQKEFLIVVVTTNSSLSKPKTATQDFAGFLLRSWLFLESAPEIQCLRQRLCTSCSLRFAEQQRFSSAYDTCQKIEDTALCPPLLPQPLFEEYASGHAISPCCFYSKECGAG